MNGKHRKMFLTLYIQSFILLWMRVQRNRTTSAKGFSLCRRMVFYRTGGGCVVFCNPPYSNIAKWVEKAFRESRKDNTLVVLLVPSRTDTKYFHDFIYKRAEIRFIRGRLKFGDSKNSAPFPSMIVIFRGAYT